MLMQNCDYIKCQHASEWKFRELNLARAPAFSIYFCLHHIWQASTAGFSNYTDNDTVWFFVHAGCVFMDRGLS